ncbi:hypothetical protein RhiirC2_779815 [Rhizophagus irregularis]|uniref:Uncharacterized protein n=1 Tax=Rhizophagus irregularis TaxID=588596 RepID=A0A2N1N8V5_9GLOM|nr:hypothetical protein RhiirC2_779815 [Rhizophagus irregularis]
MVNAIPLHKRATVFGKCPPIPGLPTQPEEISVSISPDPVVPGQTDTFTLLIGLADLQGLPYAAYAQDIPPTKSNTHLINPPDGIGCALAIVGDSSSNIVSYPIASILNP